MRVSRLVAGLAATVTAVLGLSLVTAGPAAAASGVWHAYGNTNPITTSSSVWACGPTSTVESNVLAQLCAVMTPDGEYFQSAVVVRNNRSSLYGVEVAAVLADYIYENVMDNSSCARSGVAANSWSVCYGKTVAHYGVVYVKQGGANGQPLQPSAPVSE
jgi:hypothetical protein